LKSQLAEVLRLLRAGYIALLLETLALETEEPLGQIADFGMTRVVG
jgi:hypothetical protein